jgi:hypothetical protein
MERERRWRERGDGEREESEVIRRVERRGVGYGE